MSRPYLINMDFETKTLIRHLSPDLKQKIKESLRAIAYSPYLGKNLQEDLKGLNSYRVRSFRIIYQIDFSKKQIQIITIGPRKTVYEELEKAVRNKLFLSK